MSIGKAFDKEKVIPPLLKSVTSLFILVFFVCSVAWTVPKQNALCATISSKISVAWIFFGFDSNWSFFAPELRTCNYDMVAVIGFEDGSSTMVPMPRFQLMEQYERYAKDKYSKWSIDWFLNETYREFWPEFARYIGRQEYSATNKPEVITVYLFTTDIEAPWKSKNRTMPISADVTGRTPKATIPVFHKTLFCYRYRPEDFQIKPLHNSADAPLQALSHQ